MAKMTKAKWEGSPADEKADAAAVRKINKAKDKPRSKALDKPAKPKSKEKDLSGSRWHLQNVISKPDME